MYVLFKAYFSMRFWENNQYKYFKGIKPKWPLCLYLLRAVLAWDREKKSIMSGSSASPACEMLVFFLFGVFNAVVTHVNSAVAVFP